MKAKPAEIPPTVAPAFSPRWVAAPVLAAYSALLFVFVYLGDPMRPSWRHPLGWYGGWHDQAEYYNMAASIAHGTLGRFQYPPGYPVLGWLTWWLFPPDPFFALDLILFAVFVHCGWRVFGAFLSSASMRLLAAIVLATFAVPLFEVPWTTSASAAALSFVLYVVVCRATTFSWGLAAGAAVGILFAARVVDVAIGGCLIGAAALESWWRQRRPPSAFLSGAALTCAVLVGLALTVNERLSGSWMGSYFHVALRQGSSPFFSLPFKLYGYVVDPFLFQGEALPYARSVVATLPICVLAPGGLVLLWRSQRRVAICFLAVVAGWLPIYAPFVAVSGLTLRFGSAHYAKVLFPVLAGAAFFAIAELAAARVPWRYAASYLAIAGAIGLLPWWFEFRPMPLTASMIHVCCHAESVALAIDGNPKTRWDTGRPRTAGMTLDIDAGRTIWFNHLKLDSFYSPQGAPDDVTLWGSFDGRSWKGISFIDQSQEYAVRDYFADPVRLRWVRVRLQKGSPSEWWSIHEMTLFAR